MQHLSRDKIWLYTIATSLEVSNIIAVIVPVWTKQSKFVIGQMLHGQMLHGQMLHGQMLHGQMLHGQMLHGQMLHGQIGTGQLVNSQGWFHKLEMSSTVLSLGGRGVGEMKIMLSQPSTAGTGLSWSWG